MSKFISIENAIKIIAAGEMLILVDDENREQEGDLVIAAEKITPAAINFMTKYARGVVCLTLEPDIVDRLDIPPMMKRNTLPNQAVFLTSIEARTGVTTGVSAFDRAHTIQVAINPNSTAADLSMPGHVFPLKAAKGGVLIRQGHTEGSVDLASLANLQPAAVICEIMSEDGTMARMPDLLAFAEKHQLPIVSINDLITYRVQRETILEEIATSELPLKDHYPTIKIFRDTHTQVEHVALIFGNPLSHLPCLVRIHSECLTSDVFGSIRCDCGQQLEAAMQQLGQEGGVLLYMRQEGRGIGLGNKIKSYQLQTNGLDTVAANHQLGFQADHRSYMHCADILKTLQIQHVRLLTNNPHKLQDLQRFGINVVERVPLEIQPTEKNKHYLQTKRDKLGHLLNLS